MAKRLIEVLRALARDLIDKGYDNTEDTIAKISAFDIDFVTIKEELLSLEQTRHIDEAELDTIKALLSYVLMKETELETEDIYAFIFGRGRHIIWN
ncbi:MAG: hypothetical protein HGA78_03900 [Nitrospirales bacterium]|nr:hypothetical protein [Nitrospirales bacterium]